MTNPIRITAEVEGAEAALEMAAMLDELSGAVAAFETREAEGKNPALWRVEAHPPPPVVDGGTGGGRAVAAPRARGTPLLTIAGRPARRRWLAPAPRPSSP